MSNDRLGLLLVGLAFAVFGVITSTYSSLVGIILCIGGVVLIISAAWPVLKESFRDLFDWRNK